MTKTHLTALLAFLAGSAAGMTSSALVREAPGTKSYFVHQLAVSQSPLADGGSDVSAVAYTTVTLDLADGGTATHDLGGVPCPLTEARKTTLRTILTAAESCARNAP